MVDEDMKCALELERSEYMTLEQMIMIDAVLIPTVKNREHRAVAADHAYCSVEKGPFSAAAAAAAAAAMT